MKSSPLKFLSAGVVCIVILGIAIGISNFARKGGVDCNELFQEVSVDRPFPVTCKVVVNSSERALLVSVDAKGDITIARNGSKIFSLPGQHAGENLDGIDILTPGEQPKLTPDAVMFEDVTFDGYVDLIVQTSSGAYNVNFNIYAYNPASRNFDLTPMLSVTNPLIDTGSKTIKSYEKGRGIGDIYALDTYRFANGKYTLIRSEFQGIISEFNTTPVIYERIVHELRNGHMVEVERQTLTEEAASTSIN